MHLVNAHLAEATFTSQRRAVGLGPTVLGRPVLVALVEQVLDGLLSATGSKLTVRQAAFQVASSHDMSMIGISAHLAAERLLVGAVSTMGEVAAWAALRGISRWNGDEGEAAFAGCPVELLEHVAELGRLQVTVQAPPFEAHGGHR
jgi:hypothetical protein